MSNRCTINATLTMDGTENIIVTDAAIDAWNSTGGTVSGGTLKIYIAGTNRDLDLRRNCPKNRPPRNPQRM